VQQPKRKKYKELREEKKSSTELNLAGMKTTELPSRDLTSL